MPQGMHPMDAQNNAFAGVAKPRKPVLCLVSMLNFAKRQAEAMTITSAQAIEAQSGFPNNSPCGDGKVDGMKSRWKLVAN